MADRPASYKSSHNVSRHTMVIRKAKDADAQRLADEEEAKRLSDAIMSSAIRKSVTTRRDATVAVRKPSVSRRMVSGRTVAIHRDDDKSSSLTVSSRTSGGQASVRVTGGDTIIRYQSGDMVVKRGSRSARLRRQAIWAYACGYLVLFGLYAYFLASGAAAVTPMEFVEKAFARRHGADIIDLERAAFEAMRGNRTPAEVRLAEPLSFHDENNDLIQIASGDRLTLQTAAKLGKAILADQERGERTFSSPLRLYRETYLANLDWPYWLTVYNAAGFFLLTLLFLWRPLMLHLGARGKTAAAALRNARDAQDEAEEYRGRYLDLKEESERRGVAMRAEMESAGEEKLERALAEARERADGIAGGMENSLEQEARARAARLGAETARRACDQARTLLEARLGQKEHDAAIDELIATIAGMRLGRE